VWSFSILAAAVIDRSSLLVKSMFSISAGISHRRGARFDWSKEAVGERAVSGMSGNKAALIIAAAMAEELTDESFRLEHDQTNSGTLARAA
jgi:hypothetical protein